MTAKDKDLLGRIDERVKAIHDKLDTVLDDNREQWKVLNNHKQDITKHQTYFKVVGWVLGSGTALGILTQGAIAFFNK